MKTYQYRLRFLIKYLGNVEVNSLTVEDFRKLRSAALSAGHSPWTIENSIDQGRQILAKICATLDTGKSLQCPEPRPEPIPLAHLNAALPHMPDWLQAFCALGYVTGLRRNDLRRLKNLHGIEDSLSHTASKTKKLHRFPIPEWCKRTVRKAGIENLAKNEHTIYRNLKQACAAAAVPYFTPQDLRILSANSWEKIQTSLGLIVLGHALPGWSSASPFYLQRFDPLFDRIYDFPAPDCLLTVEERCRERARKERMQRALAKLTKEKFDTLLTVAESMAG